MMTILSSISRRQSIESGKTLRWRGMLVTLVVGVVLAGISAAPALATVGSLSVTLSSTSTNATQVKYSVGFVSTHALLANSSKVALSAPAGTKFPSSGCDYFVEDPRTHQTANCQTPAVSIGENEVTFTPTIGANAGDHFVVIVNGVSNTSTTGSQNVGIATSADPTIVNQAVNFTAPTSVGSASVSLSSTSANATQVTYTANFRATHALTAGYSTITLNAPSGTTFPSSGCVYTVTDTRTHQSYTCNAATVSGPGNSVTITMSAYGANANDSMVVTVNGVSNTSTTGSQNVSVSTSSDPAPFNQAVNFTAPTSVGSASVSLSSTSVNATQVAYTASFRATHALTAGYSTITLTAPSGTTFPASSCSNYIVTDTTTTQSYTCNSAVVSGPGNSVVINVSVYGANANDSMVVTVNGVSNTSTTGSQNVSVSTSSDPAPFNQAVNFTAPTSVGSASVSLSSTSVNATQVAYTASFRATHALTAGYSTITLTAPSGTTFPASSCSNYIVTDTTTTQSYTCNSAVVSGPGNS